jgi:hypothetical protein
MISLAMSKTTYFVRNGQRILKTTYFVRNGQRILVVNNYHRGIYNVDLISMDVLCPTPAI